jgi:hypothetical protein
MNRIEIAEWLFKRVSSKVDDLRYSETEEVAEKLADDVDSYMALLKDIVTETLLP